MIDWWKQRHERRRRGALAAVQAEFSVHLTRAFQEHGTIEQQIEPVLHQLTTISHKISVQQSMLEILIASHPAIVLLVRRIALRSSAFLGKAFWRVSMLALALLLLGCNRTPTAASADTHASAASEPSAWFDPSARFKNPQALALARAAQDNNADEVRRLITSEHINPDTLFSDDGYGIPVVAWPVITDSLGGLKALLDNGANPNARKAGRIIRKFDDGSVIDHFKYENALVYAAMNESPAYLKLLLDRGGDPNTRNGNNETLLFQAFIWHNQWPNVQTLVEHGADINAVTQDISILGDYTQEGDFKKAYWLLQHGADPKAQSSWIVASPNVPIRYFSVEDIFWYPAKPSFFESQRQCQQWLLAHGFQRPAMPEHYRKQRKALGLPYEEKDIPLL